MTEPIAQSESLLQEPKTYFASSAKNPAKNISDQQLKLLKQTMPRLRNFPMMQRIPNVRSQALHVRCKRVAALQHPLGSHRALHGRVALGSHSPMREHQSASWHRD
jgi:hypothetical protein